MFYPLALQQGQPKIFPLFGDALKGRPYILDLSPAHAKPGTYATTDYQTFQKQIFEKLDQHQASWAIGKYLEDRSGLLHDYPDMIDEGRIYHAGLDIIVPPQLPLFAPIAGEVYETIVDEGLGSYGGIVVLRHQLGTLIFYSLYGHLNTDFDVKVGQAMQPGDLLGRIGEDRDSGGWFTHTHLQILTEKAVNQGWLLKGYVTEKDLPRIESLFPTPYPLFCY